jgi:nicotinate-nucleotide adenylyltransferase
MASETTSRKRVGLFGGTFDPPHRGHLRVACEAARAFALEKVLLAPVGLQPLKRTQPVASYEERLEMVERLCVAARRACTGVEFEASQVDAPRGDGQANYTIDTVERVRAELGAEAELFVVVGADSFLDVRRWRASDALLEAAQWIVVSRPGFSLERLNELGLSTAQRERVHLLDGVEEPASATALRARLRAGDDCTEWLTPEVSKYIREAKLYGAG